jgi:hypothetical protein
MAERKDSAGESPAPDRPRPRLGLRYGGGDAPPPEREAPRA